MSYVALEAAMTQAETRLHRSKAVDSYAPHMVIGCWIAAVVATAAMTAPFGLVVGLMLSSILVPGAAVFVAKRFENKARCEYDQLQAVMEERSSAGRLAQLAKSKEAFEKVAASGMALENNVRVGPALTLKSSAAPSKDSRSFIRLE